MRSSTRPSTTLRAALAAAAAGWAELGIARDARVRRMIVDRLEVLGLDRKPIDACVGGKTRRDPAYQILDEARIVVGALGHVFFVGALQDAEQLGRGFLLGDAQELRHVEMG